MADTRQEFDPRNEPKSVYAHQALDEEHRENNQSDVPPLRNVIWVIQYH
jgi:hypothetical protein